MRAIRTTPTAIIQQIKNNLRDNYDPGFPILKELVQNADDAEATTLDVAFVAGLAHSDVADMHPLLSGPALIVLNDGRFDPQDAEKIALMGEGNKSGKLPAIGKFGLGLKSIFHACESFFYLACPDPPSKVVRREFINPWADTSLHPEWRSDLSDAHVGAMLSQIRRLLPSSDQWFCLWVPLRTKQQLSVVHPLTAEYPGDDVVRAGAPLRFVTDPAASIFGPDYDLRLASLFPMMKHLRGVRSWLADLARPLHELRRVERDAAAATTQVHHHEGPFAGELRGTIRVERPVSEANPERHYSAEIQYCGRERWMDDPRVDKLKASPAWPGQMWTDAQTGQEISGKEKAIPHVAAYLVSRPATGQAKFRTLPAVFLPLSDASALTCDCAGDEDVDMVLHGYFFVDAGRRGINFGITSSESATPDGNNQPEQDERQIRLAWNRLLNEGGVLPLVLPALDLFANQRGRGAACLDHVTEVLSPRQADGQVNRSSIAGFCNQHRQALCKQYQWIKRLTQTGPRWQLVEATTPVYTLPQTNEKEDNSRAALPLSIFPRLCDYVVNHALTLDERWLCAKQPESLPIDALCDLLRLDHGFNAADAFAQPTRAAYVLEVISHVQSGRAPSAELHTAVLRVARAVLVNNDVPESESPLIPLIKRLIAHLPPTRRLVLRSRGKLPRELLDLDLNVLLVPNALSPDGETKPAQVSAEDSCCMLRVLARLRDRSTTPSPLLTDLACQVLEACDEKTVRPQVLIACGDLPLFDALDLSDGQARAYTARELGRARDARLIFARNESSELVACSLQKAIASCMVFLTSVQVGRVLFGALPDCGVAPCMLVLHSHPHLNHAPDRSDLLELLLLGESQWKVEDLRAVRFLLHGNIDAGDDGGQLFASGQRGPWAKLLKLVLDLTGEGWRVVTRDLSSHLNVHQARRLGLSEVDAASVSSHLAALAIRESTGQSHELLDEVTPWARLDLVGFSEEDLGTLFDEFPLDGEAGMEALRTTFRDLPLHRALDGSRRSIGPNGYLDDPDRGFDLDEGMRSQLVVFARDENPVRAAKQELLFGKQRLTPEVIVYLAAGDGNVKVHWSTLLSALSRAGDHPRLDDLRLKPWVPTRTGHVAPIDIPFIPDVDLRQELPDVQLTCEADLLPAFIEHGHYASGRKLFLKADEALGYIGRKLCQHDRYMLGPKALHNVVLTDVLRAFEGDSDCMPCRPILVRLVESTSAERCRQHLASHLLGPIRDAARWVSILNHLARRDEDCGNDARNWRDLFLVFLAGSMQHQSFRTEILPQVRLLNMRGRWCRANALCIDWPGVAEACVLDARQHEVLSHVIGDKSAVQSQSIAAVPDLSSQLLATQVNESAALLRQHFARWSSAPPGAITGFLCLLGDHPEVVGFAEELVQPRRISSVRDMLPWRVLEGNISGAGLTAPQAIGSRRFIVAFDQGSTVHAINLLGEPFDAPISKDPDHLIIGRPEPHRDTDQRLYYRVVLREIDVAQLSPSRVSDLLRESALLLLNWVYWQWHVDLNDMWQTLAATDQLDIVVTQQILLDRAPANLPKLRTDRIPSLRNPLRDLDEAFHRLEEAKQAAGPLRSTRMAEAQRTLEGAKQTLAKLLTENAAAQAEVLDALRGKVQESGYSASSVPFELLQNADDASVEYHEMHGTSESSHPDSSRFRIEGNDERIRFIHWGRPINKYRYGRFDGSDRGFRSDLSKMLAMGESDKLSGVEVKNTTGQFGLGFKSVFLIADRPRVISGWLAFEVVAGIYPKRLEGTVAAHLRFALQVAGPSDGTAIELDISRGLSPLEDKGPLERFLRLAHLAVVCTRQLRRLEVHLGDTQQSFVWSPKPVDGVCSAECGRVRPWNRAASPFCVLALGNARGKLLLRMGSSVIEPFDDDVPTVWVTAPTMHCDGVGVAINGDFKLDPGRSQLLSESSQNLMCASELGRLVGEQLERMFDASESDWPGLRTALQLDADATRDDFWRSAFALLAERLSRCQGRSRALLMEVLWADRERGMHRLLQNRMAIPSGLPAPYTAHLRLNDVHFVIDESLLGKPQAPLTIIAKWASFQEHVRQGTCASFTVVQCLRNLGVSLPQCRHLTLADVVGFELSDRSVTPESAARLATVVSSRLTEDAALNLRHYQPDRLGEILRDAEFVARDGLFHSVPELLISGTAGDDETKRAAFAPASAVLSPDYAGVAADFFRTCRLMHLGRMKIGVIEMSEWAVRAMYEDAQIAVLKYLVDGELAAGLGAELQQRIAQDVTVWLSSIDKGEILQRAFPDSVNQQQLVLARLGMVKVLGWGELPAIIDVEEPPPPHSDPGQVLRQIAVAWRKGPGRQLYDSQIYVGSRAPQCRLEELSSSLPVRREWMRLFMLGSMHTIGLAHRSEHGSFMQMCERQGWLNVFANPDMDPRQWLAVLDEYLDPAVRDVKYYRRMQRFISFYQVARHLAEYAYCFHDMNHCDGFGSLSQVLRSRENPLQSGGGANLPPLTSALGIGACFVVRELVHCGFIRNPAAHRYCYVPVRRVRLLLSGMGCSGLLGNSPDRWELSSQIYEFLSSHLGPDGATFEGDFDLPLIAAAEGKLTTYGLSEECERYVEVGMQDLGE